MRILNKKNHKICKRYGSVVAIVISLFALATSYEQTNITKKSREDFVALQKLSIEPNIEFITYFPKENNQNAYSEFTNSGAIDILQVDVKGYELEYDPDFNGFRVLLTNNNYFFKQLSPQEPKILNWGKTSEWMSSTMKSDPKDLNYVFQVEISYKRPADLKEYTKNAYYFINEKGEFISEARVIGENKYREILECAHRNRLIKSHKKHQKIANSDILN